MRIETLPPILSVQHFFIVNRFKNALAWGGWREWYHYELGLNVFPETMTTTMPYPPQNQEGADKVAARINEVRKKPDNSRGKKGIINPVPVPEHPAPWRKWSHEKAQEYLAELNEEMNGAPTRSQEEIDHLIRTTRQRHGLNRRYRPEAKEAQNPKLAYEPTPPDLAAERARILAAKLAAGERDENFYHRE